MMSAREEIMKFLDKNYEVTGQLTSGTILYKTNKHKKFVLDQSIFDYQLWAVVVHFLYESGKYEDLV